MRVLAFDCATAACSAAVWDEGEIRAHEAAELAQGATQALVPMLARVMARAGLGFDEIDRLGVTIGPGHFTGLRAGLAVARGLQRARALPAVGITTLESIAAATDPAARTGRRIVAALDSKRAEPFLQVFDEQLCPLGPPLAMSAAAFIAGLDAGPILVVGDAGPMVMSAFAQTRRHAERWIGALRPDAATVARLAAARAPLAGLVEPLYLHPPAVKPQPGMGPSA